MLKIVKYISMAVLIPIFIGYYNHITAIRTINTIQRDIGLDIGSDYDLMAIEYAHNNGDKHPIEVSNNLINYWVSGIRSITYTMYQLTVND